MKITKNQWVLFGTISVVSLIAGGIYLTSQFKKAMQYSYQFVRFTAKSVSMQNVAYEIVYKVNNPSKIKYTINSIDTVVRVENTIITKLSTEIVQDVPANGSSDLVIPGNISPSDIVNAIKSNNRSIIRNLATIGQTMVVLDMKINIGLFGTLFNIKVPYQYQFPLKSILPESMKK